MLVEIILGLFVLIQTYVVWNLMRKTELLETWIEDFNNTIQTIDNELKEIDSSGHFKFDDEVGSIFKQIKQTVKQLESYKGEEQ
tara:strand:- start:106 stop:357 length:252 start_codon:yes stop_codon:yes gene_type:complete